MIYPHRIRLRGPWDCVPVETRGGGILPAARRVTMPGRFADHGLASFTGRARFVRKFGYPGRIDDLERIWLTCAGFDGTARIELNDILLAREQRGPFALDVTALMEPHNMLAVTVAADTEHGGLWGEVALEIRCTAYLRDMGVSRRDNGAIEVRGVVAGSCDGPLELYTLLDGGNADYRTTI